MWFFLKTRFQVGRLFGVFSSFLGDLLVRFYIEIIAGVWAVVIMMPLDNYLYTKYTGQGTYVINGNFWIFFVIFTVAFVLLGVLVPKVRKRKFLNMLNVLVQTNQITISQKKKMYEIACRSQNFLDLFTKNGMLQFLMKNIFSVGIVFAYFAFEGLIVKTMFGETRIVAWIFFWLFIALLILEGLLDGLIAKNMVNQKKKQEMDIGKIYGSNKKLITYLLDGVSRGNNLSEKVSQVVYEDTVEDISKIMLSSNDNEGTKMKREAHPKKQIPKGKNEKIKRGIVVSKVKKRKNENLTKQRNGKRKGKRK